MKLSDRYGNLTALRMLVVVVILVLAAIFIPLGLVIGSNIAWVEGVETTVTGTVQLHMLKYNKFWNMEYTDCELRTYSGDTHHVSLIGHINLEYQKTYTITYVKTDYWAHLYIVNVPVNITEIQGEFEDGV